ncbi:hypothetical protein CYMTET_49011 [Cymbomonas tetramitiformis]|uniref:Uncharacterized protein n=1 Tax=Cymbomonas tetramitiformis TaxID=36881 RepID=A0AAE0BSS9_9CHLO|nr:hypothetical protein CYMTET_49011 [Cymbomonas tetramitiformis]
MDQLETLRHARKHAKLSGVLESDLDLEQSTLSLQSSRSDQGWHPHMHLISSPLVFFQSLDVVSAECDALVEMAVNVLQVLNQACGIERINKNADTVHSKARQLQVLLSFENELDSSDDELPAGTAAPQEEEEEEDTDTTEPELVDHRKVFDCPTGFKVLEKPATGLSSAETLIGLFILMLWEAEGWELGKLMKLL